MSKTLTTKHGDYPGKPLSKGVPRCKCGMPGKHRVYEAGTQALVTSDWHCDACTKELLSMLRATGNA